MVYDHHEIPSLKQVVACLDPPKDGKFPSGFEKKVCDFLSLKKKKIPYRNCLKITTYT